MLGATAAPRPGRRPVVNRNILAINFNHDGSGVIVSDGTIAAYVNTERFSRKKKHPGLRQPDLEELLGQAGLALSDVDHVLLCNLHTMDTPDIPRLHGSDLKETWFPFWINQTNNRVRIDNRELPCTVNPDHHVLHAAAAYLTSPFESAMVLVTDPLGCRAFIGKGNRLYPIRHEFEREYHASVGYCYVADELFGSSVFGAGKVMGLAPYGRTNGVASVDPRTIDTFEKLQALANERPVFVEEGEKRLNATLAYCIQLGLERQMTEIARRLAEIAARNNIEPNLCLGGGAALNAPANEVALRRSPFLALHLHPACGDDGTAIGAGLWYWHRHVGHDRRHFSNRELMYSVRLYDDRIPRALERKRTQVEVDERADYIVETARLIRDGKVVAWFQGPSEIGPRALGNRSILADPRDAAVKDRLNGRIKFRESFRPFAPSVLNEHADEWFSFRDSPFMLRTASVQRNGIAAVTHVDNTARIQTISRNDNPSFYALVERFCELTGVPMLLNTSFNIKGEPIVETPDEAIDSFLKCELDALVFPGFIVTKRNGRR